MIPKRYWFIGVILALGLPGEAGATEKGRVEPKVRWAQGDPSTCRYGVLGESRTQPVTSLLTLSPGEYRISVRCGEDPELIPPPATVRVRAGQVARPRFDVARAKVRIMTRRSGNIVAGEAQLFECGRAGEDAPILTHATNVTAKLAAGQYDLRVRLDDDAQPKAQAFLRNVRLKPGRNSDLEVDLSDGSLVAHARQNRRRAAGAVRVFHAGTEKQVALGDTEQELRLPAGEYDVTVELRSAANFATETETVWVRAGRTTKVDAAFTTGELAVRVVQDGKPIDATVRLSLPLATDFFNFFEAPGAAVLSPGKYNVTVSAEAAKALGDVKRSDVVVRARRTTKVTVDLSQATLQVDVRENGQPAKAIVEVREAGGGDVVARLGQADVRLWPGRYELVAKLPDGSEKVDGPFEVALGQRVKRKISFERAQLEVEALRGPAPEVEARVLVFRRGAAKPTAEGKHGERLELPEGTYDIKVIAGADTVWKQDVRVAGTAKVQVALPELVDEAPLPAGDAPAEDFELPAGDADPDPEDE